MKHKRARGIIALCPAGEGVEQGYVEDYYPPHVTVIPSFNISQSTLYDLDAVCKMLLSAKLSVRARVGRLELFDPNNNTEVRLIEGIDDMIHRGLLAAIGLSNLVHSPEYVGDNWVPHITDHEGCSIGEEIVFQGLGIFLKGAGHKTLYRYYTGGVDDEV